MNNNKTEVPKQFQPHIRVDYPPNNDLIFEEWFHKEFIGNDYEREYLPIFWTSYYVNYDYGNDKIRLKLLQDYIDGLDTSKKYFTIVQYDDGVLNDLSKIDCKVFGMGGGKYDYALPLLTKPHPYSFTPKRDVFCNFMGSLTHQIRKDIIPVAQSAGYLVSTSQMPIQEYCLNLSRSIFTLAPRGYGLSSFRIMEAIQYGSIPVYISDKFMIPYGKDFNYGVLIEPKDISRIDEILKGVNIEDKRKEINDHLDYFTYKGCMEFILSNI